MPLRLELNDSALQRKLAAARTYPELRQRGGDGPRQPRQRPASRVECLRPVRYGLDLAGLTAHPPFYETHGEQRVAMGLYGEVIRFQSHLAPLAAELKRYVTEESRRAWRVLLTNGALVHRAGSELYLVEVASRLLALGHSPIAYSPILGPLAAELRASTVPVVDDLAAVAEPPDLIHGSAPSAGDDGDAPLSGCSGRVREPRLGSLGGGAAALPSHPSLRGGRLHDAGAAGFRSGHTA